jgi:hypothetical protein
MKKRANALKNNFIKIDRFLDRHREFLLVFLLLVILRLPNFFEPYYYMDESIYLTIGNALSKGSRLYAEIIDHKTPLIYYFAAMPSLFHFRLLNFVWAALSLAAFWKIAEKIFKNLKAVVISSLAFVFLTSWPLFEGNVPNGELFVLGFVLVAGYLLTWTNLFKQKNEEKFLDLKKMSLYFSAGFLFGLAILTKVPALFDGLAWVGLLWFGLVDKFSLKNLFLNVKRGLIILAGIISPIVLSIIYYVARGAGQAYLDFGLLYNFRYVQSWGLPFDNEILIFLFSLQGKVLVMALILLALAFLKKYLSFKFKFVVFWFVLSLVATTLSNRPYPHYFIQLVPPLALLIGFILEGLLLKLKTKKLKFELGGIALALILSGAVLGLLDVQPNLGFDYYRNFVDYASGKMNREEYYQKFDYITKDNYEAASIITKSDDPNLFIWGTNPALYALTKKIPTGRFTVSFHIKDFGVEAETFADFVEKQPMFVVVMKNEVPLLGLDQYLQNYYIPNENFSNFVLWKKVNSKIDKFASLD